MRSIAQEQCGSEHGGDQVVTGVQQIILHYAGMADIINGSSGEVYGPREVMYCFPLPRSAAC